jgi:flavin-dependent dehydrogenase
LAGLPWRGTPALTRRPRRRAAERVFALGDAAGYVEPFTGEGMAWALSAAVALAPLVARAAERWESRYVRVWPRAFQCLVVRSQVACRAAAFVLRRPLLARVLVGILSRAPFLARPVLARLHAPLIPQLCAGCVGGASLG